ncbi:MAG: hypothetical protein EOP45_13015 [Sphingobacteriaceae bacterium]|nr:MAG: hypothetical protein EOP45_13015 [Sphingobacteriaceae bacterium]
MADLTACLSRISEKIQSYRIIEDIAAQWKKHDNKHSDQISISNTTKLSTKAKGKKNNYKASDDDMVLLDQEIAKRKEEKTFQYHQDELASIGITLRKVATEPCTIPEMFEKMETSEQDAIYAAKILEQMSLTESMIKENPVFYQESIVSRSLHINVILTKEFVPIENLDDETAILPRNGNSENGSDTQSDSRIHKNLVEKL